MHADEVDVDAALVRRLVASQFPHWTGLTVEPVRFFGTDNAIYRLGDELAVRLPRRRQNAVQLEKERRWLPRLAPRLPLTVPVPLAPGSPATAIPSSGPSTAGSQASLPRTRPSAISRGRRSTSPASSRRCKGSTRPRAAPRPAQLVPRRAARGAGRGRASRDC